MMSKESKIKDLLNTEPSRLLSRRELLHDAMIQGGVVFTGASLLVGCVSNMKVRGPASILPEHASANLTYRGPMPLSSHVDSLLFNLWDPGAWRDNVVAEFSGWTLGEENKFRQQYRVGERNDEANDGGRDDIEGHNVRAYCDPTRALPSPEIGDSYDGINDPDLEVIPDNGTHSIATHSDRTQDNFFVRTEAPIGYSRTTIESIALDVPGRGTEQIPVARFSTTYNERFFTLLECAGNDKWCSFRLMSAAQWEGVSLAKILDPNSRESAALLGAARHHISNCTHVEIEGYDDPNPGRYFVRSIGGASWIFQKDELIDQQAFFATKINGQELPLDHGFPVRLVVPGWYGCASIKWVKRIKFFSADSTTQATTQMFEFRDRTNQLRDIERRESAGLLLLPDESHAYRAPRIELAATVIKVERFALPGGRDSLYRIIGLMWGGTDLETSSNIKLEINITDLGYEKKEQVIDIERNSSNRLGWQLWTHWWNAPRYGSFSLDMIISALDGTTLPTTRLDNLHYRRVLHLRA